MGKVARLAHGLDLADDPSRRPGHSDLDGNVPRVLPARPLHLHVEGREQLGEPLAQAGDDLALRWHIFTKLAIFTVRVK
ncbi:MAG: hypothetical protein AB7G75_19730 [Candidatus Binatia bacterium]